MGDPIAANAPETWSIWFSYAGAIASGAVMVTGIEHLASSAPYHAKPRARRAGRTLVVAVAASAVAFFVVAYLSWLYRITGWSRGPSSSRSRRRCLTTQSSCGPSPFSLAPFSMSP
ncbi:hypothetical protein [Demequina litorisediminis]|uniref:hypothetical protein n=1 Tax=Demequina litorisediminis TaxID=1849022 RepID=UPI0024E11981|nr:hypothetical protein [Demequina litorisediminis]